MTAASFQPLGMGWLAPIAFALLWLVLRDVSWDHALMASLAYSLAFMLVLLWWLSASIGPGAWFALGTAQAVVVSLGVLGVWTVRTLPAGPLWSALAWCGAEFMRSTWPLGGMPWGQLGFTAVDTWWAALLPYVGVPGTSLFVAFAGFTLAEMVRSPGPRTFAMSSAAVVIPSILTLLPAPSTHAGSADIALIQGGVPGDGSDLVAHHRQVTRNHVARTLDLARDLRTKRETVDLVVWPENSTAVDPLEDAQARALIERAVVAVDAPLLVGGIVNTDDPERAYNRGILWLPDRTIAGHYTKTHLVPFGEYIPWRETIGTWFDRFSEIPRDMIPGKDEGPLELDRLRVADAICFDIAYDDVLQAQIRRGANLAVVQTSNAMFYGTSQPSQQFEITRVRAAEIGRSIVVASTNGTSGVIDPQGRIVKQAPAGVSTRVRATVSLQVGLTPAVRYQHVRDPVILAGATLGVLWAFARRTAGLRRRRRSGGLATRCSRRRS
ncbi:hypothetical protein ASG90_17145 [Nocardioides sp. Soil797]|nr:hypothetical protein ASG90_17145 [Nocardioides sp. Soil797]